MSRAPRDLDELRELAGDDPREFAATLEADGRAEGDPTRVEEARIVRRHAAEWKAAASPAPAAKAAATDPPAGKPSAPRKAAKATRAPAKASKRRSAPRTSATRRALREAVVPDRQLAGGIRRAGSTAWSLAAGMVALILVYLLVTKGSQSIAAIRELERFATAVVYPPAAFPERHAGATATQRKAKP